MLAILTQFPPSKPLKNITFVNFLYCPIISSNLSCSYYKIGITYNLSSPFQRSKAITWQDNMAKNVQYFLVECTLSKLATVFRLVSVLLLPRIMTSRNLPQKIEWPCKSYGL